MKVRLVVTIIELIMGSVVNKISNNSYDYSDMSMWRESMLVQ